MLLGHKVILVGDNGIVNPVAGHIGGDHLVDLVGGVCYLIFFQGIFHFEDTVIDQIDVVVVQLPEQVEPGHGLDGPPAVPAGELVQQIRFQLFHIVAGENALRRQGRSLGQCAPLRPGGFLIGQDNVPDGNAEEHHKGDGRNGNIFDFLHGVPP